MSPGFLLPLIAGLTAYAMEQPAPNAPIASLPLEFREDIPFLQVKINDAGPFWFNVDSGAGACVIDKAAAAKLNIHSEGELRGTGAGAGTFPYSLANYVRLNLGQISFTPENVRVIDLSGVPAPADRKLIGLLGYDFLQRYIVSLGYEKSVMTIYDPKNFIYRGPGAALHISFRKNVPWVRGKILVAGQTASERDWLIDTGSADSLNDELLAASTGEKKKLTGGHGLGKEFAILQAKADRVELGPFRFSDVIGFSGGMKIGGGLLRYFTVIFDYPSDQMILEANSRYHR
jgi:hypothetical protein